MTSIVSNTMTVFIIVSYVLVSGVVGQSTPYKLRERPDCETHCKTMQQFNGSCPRYGSCQWHCQEKQENCTPGTRYHCARDLRNKNKFIEACSAEIFCLEGEEPHISKQESGEVSVYCRPCYQNNSYNSQYNTSSTTFSECHSAKTNLCTELEHKVDCGNVSFMELTKTDGYCRCDARKGYAAESEEMCFYENKRCFKKICPQGEELLLNYSCAKECRSELASPKTSDNCQHVTSLPPATTSVFTTVVDEDNAHNLSTEKPHHPRGLNTYVYALIATAVTVVIAVIAATILLVHCKRKIGECLRQICIRLRPKLKPSKKGRQLSSRAPKQQGGRNVTSEEIPLNTLTANEEASVDANQVLPSAEHAEPVEDCFVVCYSESDVDSGESVPTTARIQARQTIGSVEHKGATHPTLTITAETYVIPAVSAAEHKGASYPTVTTTAKTYDTQAGTNINDRNGASSSKPADISSEQELKFRTNKTDSKRPTLESENTDKMGQLSIKDNQQPNMCCLIK